MPVTPAWEAARNGAPGNLNATNHAAQINQFLGTHQITPVYEGAQTVVLSGGTNFISTNFRSDTDLDQMVTLPGGVTTLGRVVLPVTVNGNGSDLLVSLYPDSGSNTPNTSSLLASTTVPAKWLSSLSAPVGLALGGPLATARFNTLSASGGQSATSAWAAAAGGPGGVSVFPSATTSGNFLLIAGGDDTVGVATVGNVNSAQFQGSGVLGLPVPQPPVPVGTEFSVLATTSSTAIYAGGQNISASSVVTTVANVWTANWNPDTGVVGSWSQQTSLPQASLQSGGATFNNTVYYVGGLNGSTVFANVYYANVNNGQIGSWLTGPPLPVPLYSMAVAVIGNWLVVAGGQTGAAPSQVNTMYYAPINSDGSLGSWLTGPTFPTKWSSSSVGWNFFTTPNSITLYGGEGIAGIALSTVQTLTFTASGPSDSWFVNSLSAIENNIVTAFPIGQGLYSVISLNLTSTTTNYNSTTMTPVTQLSVPLPATGLTPGAKYHVLLQQYLLADASDYVSFGLNTGTTAADAIKSVRNSGTWTTAQTGYAVPLVMYDNTTGGQILHTWQDPSALGSAPVNNLAARTTTTIRNTLGLPIGFLESTVKPKDALNVNPTFTAGVASWTPVGCTFTQSSTQVHGGFPFSGLMTPDGVTAAPSVSSEMIPIKRLTTLFDTDEFFTLNGWLYSPTGYGSNLTVNVDWYTRTSTLISTSTTATPLVAATWTNTVNTYLPPATATTAVIRVSEAGTPTSSNTVFFSNIFLSSSIEITSSVPSVVSISYAAGSQWPPVTITELV